jgi:hypothetical protein
MLIRTRSVVAAGVLAAGAALSMAGPSTAVVVPNSAAAGAAYAPAASAKIHPGVMMYTDGAQCTANFVFTDGAGNTYVGYAAHCAGTGAATDTNGCDTKSLPLGTKVTFNEGGSLVDEGTQVGTGTLAYSSWLTMQRVGETNANACDYNDLALVKVDPADVGSVNPSVPSFGGPVGLNTSGTTTGAKVYSYGNSELRLGLSPLSPKYGVSLGDSNGGWNHTVYTVTPGIPGDSGSGFLDSQGRAFGVLSTVAIAPIPASNGVGDLSRELAYMHAHSSFSGVTLVPGTEPFTPAL